MNKGHDEMQKNHYRRFAVMIGLHFIAMYVFMYAMVNSFANVFNNFNQVYMAALMTSSMVLIELPLMWSMYKSKKLNIASLRLVCSCWWGRGLRFESKPRSMIVNSYGQ